MMRLLIYISVLILVFSCALAMATKVCSESGSNADVIKVFLTGNGLGALKPCGCSGGQLGGFERRAAILEAGPKSKKLSIDTGMFIEGSSEQDAIKFNIIMQALNLLDYDVVNLTVKDIQVAQNLGILNGIGSFLNVISSQQPNEVNIPVKFSKRFLLNNRNLLVTVGTFDPEKNSIEQINRIFTREPNLLTVNILILNQCNNHLITSIVGMGIVDCLICPPESDEATMVGKANEKPLVVSVGRYGKYVGKLEIKAGSGNTSPELSFSAIPVKEDLPQDKSLVELYKSYQQIVKRANLLEKYPRFVLPNGLRYTGSKSCKSCHAYEYEEWRKKPHASAYTTLEKAGSQYDPECVICHVVGMEYENGFVSEEKTGHLKDVGCENCHGPGSKHNETEGTAKTSEPKSDCTVCHTPEHSTGYAGNEQYYFNQIIHWREPNVVSNVK